MVHPHRVRICALWLGAVIALAGCREHTAPDPSNAVRQAEASLPRASLTAFRLARLEGYLLAASRQATNDSAAALVSQGVTEAYDGEPGAFADTGLEERPLRLAASGGQDQAMQAALAGLAQARRNAGGDPAAVARALVQLASKLYAGVENGGGVDALEYQHSLAAVLAAQAVADGGGARLAAAKPELDRLAALWPGPVAPALPTPPAQVEAQAARAAAALA